MSDGDAVALDGSLFEQSGRRPKKGLRPIFAQTKSKGGKNSDTLLKQRSGCEVGYKTADYLSGNLFGQTPPRNAVSANGATFNKPKGKGRNRAGEGRAGQGRGGEARRGEASFDATRKIARCKIYQVARLTNWRTRGRFS